MLNIYITLYILMTSGCEALYYECICLSSLMASKFLQHMLDVGSQNYVVNVLLLFFPEKYSIN